MQVIDRFEAIDIDSERAQRLPEACGALNLEGRKGVEMAPIAGVSQGIDRCQPFQLAIGELGSGLAWRSIAFVSTSTALFSR